MNYKIEEGYWIWGKFDKKSTIILKKIYSEVNNNLLGPKFDIHLTISGPVPNPSINKNALDLFNQIGLTNNSIDLIPKKYSHTEKIFESLFIEIKLDKKLKDLKYNIDKKFNVEKKFFNPHISLYYGKKSSNIKQHIISKLSKLPAKLKLVKLCYVHIDKKINNWIVINDVYLK